MKINLRTILKYFWLISFLAWTIILVFFRESIFTKNEIIWMDNNLIELLIKSYNFIDVYFFILITYISFVSIFGLFPKKFKKKNNQLIIPNSNNYYAKFVLIICAHNEEQVIENSLKGMLKTSYPLERLKIVVVCDNCTDSTYIRAYNFALQYPHIVTIIERKDDDFKGKPYAVKYAFDFINKFLPDYEAVSIADADNVYDSKFFDVMNYKLLNGCKVIQGYLGVKNPYDSFVTTSSMFGYSVSARSYFSARQNLGMNVTIGGTGFVLTKDVIQFVGWDMTSLVEDFEFSAKCVLKGVKIDYAYDAKTYDEKPIKLKASVKQRSRWYQGHWNVAFRYSPKLIWALLTRPHKINIFSTIDYLIYMFSPGRLIMYAWLFIALLFLIFLEIAYPENYLSSLFILGINARLFIFIFPRLVEIYYGVNEGFKLQKLPQLFYYYTVFFITWMPGAFTGLINWRNQHQWDKTEHTAQFELAE